MRTSRAFIMLTIFLFIFSSLLGRVFYIQIIKGEEMASQAAAMRSRQIELKEYERGEIFDRNLMPLTSNVVAAAVYCLPGVIRNQHSPPSSDDEHLKNYGFKIVSSFLGKVLEDKKQDEIFNMLLSGYESNQSFVRIDSNLSIEEIELINNSQFSGVVVAPILKRYSEDGFLGHILGYVSGGRNPKGKSGLELEYDEILSKSPSSQELITVLDARGLSIQGLMFKLRNEQNQDKGSIVLTIDKRIQEIVEKAMDDGIEKGAVLVLDAETKEILALANRPTYNPYKIADTISIDTNSSLVNRALTRYYPGSLFKVAVVTAALEEGIIKPDERYLCDGKYWFNENISITCWDKDGHGDLDLEKAFAMSCNPTFIDIGIRLGHQTLLQYVDLFQLTNESITGYTQQRAGSYVDISSSNPAIGNASIGQQGVKLTPLQIANLFATIADDGSWKAPSLVRSITDYDGNKDMLNKETKAQIISKDTAQKVKEMLEKVVIDGTGQNAALAEVQVAGKTATSQTGMVNENNEEILNAWFAGYFPANNPEWVVVVLAEDGRSGSQDAAPVFKDIARGILNYFPTHH
ncbi:hypothetical protein SYNTR_0318 [Candidatus Syntrophocurvum alkaliphilum]|uniref:Peptidoglycan glycosyltransferase n=1 Tax=Candidatus Syntrophocurvum alkaliphilum TaxID=2293317 RepID=A0A6I6DEH6_9FIRM|nr:penicillin-binding protein 2 [Candidatus Syntrophocurvum alkaliphilum]QGT98911.1 hypothetical protein SYNTR_0318 [Candidatus Syntrophocurvum alkaliphilum]